MVILQEPLLRVESISKYYSDVVANDEVSFQIDKGEIHALLGENGAGKSTLVKIIYGLEKPNAGSMYFDGRFYKPKGPHDSRSKGNGMVFQHFSLFNSLTVAENVALGIKSTSSVGKLGKEIITTSKTYGLQLDPNQLVGNLSAGERQRIEIVRCLLQNPKLLIMDEPTSVLTPNEIQDLFKTLRYLATEGVSILYISHKLEEIRALCGKATIMRRGRVVDSCIPKMVSSQKIAESMVGASFESPIKRKSETGDILLEVEELCYFSKVSSGLELKGINFSLREGEILGIGGVAGSGQDELLSILSGEVLVDPRMIKFKGTPIGNMLPPERRNFGLFTAPEERIGHAAAPQMTLVENALITAEVSQGLSRLGMFNYERTKEFTARILKEFDVRTSGVGALAQSLSGGNLQKFVVGRELLQNPVVFVANQPTWGVDAAAASSIRQKLLDLVETGAAVIVISQDLDELLQITDRFSALVNGKLSESKFTKDLTISEIGLLLSSSNNDNTLSLNEKKNAKT